MRKDFILLTLIAFVIITGISLFWDSFWGRTIVIFFFELPVIWFLANILYLHIEGCERFDKIKGDGIEYTLIKKFGGITQLVYTPRDENFFLDVVSVKRNILGFPKNTVKPGTRFMVTKKGRIRITTLEI